MLALKGHRVRRWWGGGGVTPKVFINEIFTQVNWVQLHLQEICRRQAEAGINKTQLQQDKPALDAD